MKAHEHAGGRGLYALTPERLAGNALLNAVGQALAGGAAWVQYRAKPGPDPVTAAAIAALCRDHGAAFIVNDDPDLAARVAADGVHLGRDDVSIERARAVVGDAAIVGVSCYNSLQRAGELVRRGADYLAFGSLQPSPTKPEAVRCPPATLTRAREFGKSVVAIGGITLECAPEVIAAGADLLAVISDLFDAPDIEARAAAYRRLFERHV